MSRPLELTIYERCTCEMDTEPHYAGKEGFKFWFAEDQAYHKRLTDPELAAEYWYARWDYSMEAEFGSDIEAADNRLETVARFATTPSYDEAVMSPHERRHSIQ